MPNPFARHLRPTLIFSGLFWNHLRLGIICGTVHICCITRYFFAGMSGPVMIDGKGNRVPVFVFENVRKNSSLAFLELDSLGTVLRRYEMKPLWPGGSTRVPDDDPKCVFDRTSCKGNQRGRR